MTAESGRGSYWITTFGCQMNKADSERMAGILESMGYREAQAELEADLVLYNTCTIRDNAEQKVYSYLGRQAQRKRTNPNLTLVVAGCVAQQEGESLLRRVPELDLVMGPQHANRLDVLLAQVEQGQQVVATEEHHILEDITTARRDSSICGWVNVIYGCNERCTYCVVPSVRGKEQSRLPEAIKLEMEGLAAQGFKEITLLGQNVNAYHGVGFDGDWGLARLLRELAKVDGLERLRYTTSHPRDMDDDLIAAHGDLDKLMPYLHLPVQSGSDRILKRMNRGHTAEDYLRLIERLRDARPDLLLSSDFIAAFPEETEAEFEETLDLIRTVNFGMAYTFKYSSRPGTPAAERPDVADEIGDDRLRRLQILCTSQQRAAQENMVGKEVGVLFEKPGRQPGQFVGKSDHLHAVHVTAEGIAPGDLRRVRVTASGTNSLAADLL